MIRQWLKILVHHWPWPLTLNEKYDRETKAVLRRVCAPDSRCVDIGCYKGDILRTMMEAAPRGRHIAFEPVPAQYQFLKEHFGASADIYPYALGNENGSTVFHYVKSNPTYSGLQRRQYKGVEEIEPIQVEVRKLDDVIPLTTPVHLMKIDVEGGELDVLKGSRQILEKWHPYLIFEHGLGGSDRYGTTPVEVFQFLSTLGYRLTLMEDFLKGRSAEGFTQAEFAEQFDRQLNCYFLGIHSHHESSLLLT